MNALHRTLRKILPFLYVRNWYDGTFEFVPGRAAALAISVGGLILILILVWWMGQPIEYAQS